MKSAKQKIINCSIIILIISNLSCDSKREQIRNILNISTENIDINKVLLESEKLNISLETPKWIYIKIPNDKKNEKIIIDNLIERNENDFEKISGIGYPNSTGISKGFWIFNETEFTKDKQFKILNALKTQKYREFGGFYNAKSKCFVPYQKKWDGRCVVYLTDEFIYIMIFQTSES